MSAGHISKVNSLKDIASRTAEANIKTKIIDLCLYANIHREYQEMQIVE